MVLENHHRRGKRLITEWNQRISVDIAPRWGRLVVPNLLWMHIVISAVGDDVAAALFADIASELNTSQSLPNGCIAGLEMGFWQDEPMAIALSVMERRGVKDRILNQAGLVQPVATFASRKLCESDLDTNALRDSMMKLQDKASADSSKIIAHYLITAIVLGRVRCPPDFSMDPTVIFHTAPGSDEYEKVAAGIRAAISIVASTQIISTKAWVDTFWSEMRRSFNCRGAIDGIRNAAVI